MAATRCTPPGDNADGKGNDDWLLALETTSPEAAKS